ncbi:serine hydrolase domain-containing protein [Nonomuraea sp. NPDC049158]|uniref:serine hydrolase domain-containing protein n=1 Tax=Nonomuraea sp. NPDC049158 TaxID=3155649 RepID=UPI0033DDD094
MNEQVVGMGGTGEAPDGVAAQGQRAGDLPQPSALLQQGVNGGMPLPGPGGDAVLTVGRVVVCMICGSASWTSRGELAGPLSAATQGLFMRLPEFRVPVVLTLVSMLVLAACSSSNSDTRPADPGSSSATPGVVDRSIQAILDKALPRGGSGTVIAARNGRVVHCAGYGMADRAHHISANCETVYDIMSMTKSFTAVAIMKLQMTGKLRVSDPISTYVGPVPADKRKITIHQLLTHTSGLPEGLGDDYDPISRQEMIAGAAKSKLVAPPGTKFAYSNLGYSLLAAIIEIAAGTDYEHFLAKEILAPAGMTRTGYILPRWDTGRIAVEYNEKGLSQGRPLDHRWAADGPYWNLRGNGGLLSTANDMYRFHRALAGDTLLDRDAKAKMFKAYAPIGLPGYDGYATGYGWVITPDGALATHSGGNGWSYGVNVHGVHSDLMVFWISNQAVQAGKWDLQDLAKRLTLTLVGQRGVGDPE